MTNPTWLALFQKQRLPENWCIPVEVIWRRYGWVPPSTECADTMLKHKTFRSWKYVDPERSA